MLPSLGNDHPDVSQPRVTTQERTLRNAAPGNPTLKWLSTRPRVQGSGPGGATPLATLLPHDF